MPEEIRKGRIFDRLTVISDGPVIRSRMLYWCCRCTCGVERWIKQRKLLEGRTTSCGCKRADPDFRREVRMQMPRAQRKAIARMGAEARWKIGQ